MKLIFKIARTELRNLFYSPVAWFLTIVFMLICAMFFTIPVSMMANYQEVLLESGSPFVGFGQSMTSGLIMSMSGFGLLGGIILKLYLFIPLLTMAVISREFNSGTFKLLYSSPVKIHQIVWGKYLAIMGYNALLSLIMLLFMVLTTFTIKNADIPFMLSGLIAFYLTVCSYTAIGMFMSSISNYQIVSAIATFMLLFALERVGGFFQEYDFIRELTYFLSINGRLNRMVTGLITSRDVIYYVLITFLFVSFCYLSLKHGREAVSKYTRFFRYVTVFLLVLIAGYFSSRPGYVAYWDATRNKVNTIKEETQQIVKRLEKDEPLEVTLYTNLLDPGQGFSRSRPSMRNNYVWDIWDPYVRFKPNIKLNYVLYYDIKDGDSSLYKAMPDMTLDSIAREIAKMNNANFGQYIKPAEIRAIRNFEDEYYRSTMELKYKGKSVVLRMYDDNTYWPNESHFAAAIKLLTADTLPTAYYSTGQLERSLKKTGEREFNRHSIDKGGRLALVNHGFKVDTVNLNTQEMPADAQAFVLADPKMKLSELALSRLKEYVNEGGNLLVMSEPGKQDVVNPVLEATGVTLQPGTLVQVSANETPDKILPFMSMDYTWLIAANTPLMNGIRNKYAKGDSTKIMNPGVIPMSYTDKGFNAHQLWVTGPAGKVWVKAGTLVTDSAAPILVEKQGDYQLDSFAVAIALDRNVNNKQQKIVVVGDADYLSNMRAQSHFTGIDYVSWMNNEEFPIRLFQKPVTDDVFKFGAATADTLKIILTWVLPGLVLILGTIIIIRRKRQ